MKQFFSSISRSTYFIIAIIVVSCLLLSGLLFNHYQRLNHDSIVDYINADEIKAYIHLDDFKQNNSSRQKDFFPVFYTDLEKRLNLPVGDLSDKLRPNIKREVAIVVTKNNDLIFIAKTKNPTANKLPGSQIFANKYLVIGQSQNSWWQNEEQVVGRLTAWSSLYVTDFIKAYVRSETAVTLLSPMPVAGLQDWLTIGLDKNFVVSIKGLDRAVGGQFLFDRLPYTPVFSLAVTDIWSAGQQLTAQQSVWQQLLPQWSELLKGQPAQITAVVQDNQRFYILALPFVGSTDKLDKWLIELVAQKFPTPRSTRLPDGTTVTELFVQPEHFAIESIGDNGQIVKVVQNDDQTWQLAYAQKDGLLFLGTSSKSITDIVKEVGYGPVTQLCPQTGPWSLYYNPLFIPQGSFLSKYSDIISKIVLYFPGDGQAYGCL